MDAKKIGTLISSLRKEKGLSQQELSDILGVSPKTISKWECAGGLPDIGMLKTIAETFGITTDELLEGNIINKEDMDDRIDGSKNDVLKKILLFIGVMVIIFIIIVFVIINKGNNEKVINDCTVIRTYYIDNIGKSNDENYLYITVHEFQVEGTYTIKLPMVVSKDLEVGSSYEFTFRTNREYLMSTTDRLFDNSEIINLEYSDKEGLDRVSEYYCDKESE